MPFRTLSLLDDLENQNQIVEDFGQEELGRRFNEALAVHNETVQEIVGDFAFVHDVPQLAYGVAETGVEMQEVDEFGSADASAASGAGNVGFPLRDYLTAVQWTRLYLQTHSVADLARQVDDRASADLRNMHRQFRRSLFNSVNNLTYVDRHATGLTLQLRAMLNADGGGVPNGPNGETFDGATHTHYLATASLVTANLQSAISTVAEHGVAGEVRVYINRAQEATIRGMTPQFQPFLLSGINPGLSASYAEGGTLDYRDPNNRDIGNFEGAIVSVKPWIPANYILVFDTGAGGTDKILGIRTRSGGLTGLGAFGIRAEHEHYPLQARQMGREFGVSVFQRHKGAVLYTGGGTYVVPTIV